MKKIFLVIILLAVIFLPLKYTHAFSLLDNIDMGCLERGDCTPCDGLQVLFNFAKFIFMSTAALTLLFGLWQASSMVMNWGNAEAVKVAKGKLMNTLLAVLIILASYLLVGTFINLFSGGTFKSHFNNGEWWKGPTCVRERPSRGQVESPSQGGNNQAVGTGCKSAWESGTQPGCGGDCGGIPTSGIDSRQCQDANQDLKSLLQCIKSKESSLSGMSLIITSISDDEGINRCRENWAKPPCSHTRGSCHYGGPSKNQNGSYAADFRASSFNQSFKNIIDSCNGNFIDETNIAGVTPHFHVSSKSCSGE